MKHLTEYLKQYQQSGGMLLIKMNKAETFKERFGPATTEDLFKQLGSLTKAMRANMTSSFGWKRTSSVY
ncbi:MAG: hypothetical protein R3C11_26170 [Planctomycetaceae bacterium]